MYLFFDSGQTTLQPQQEDEKPRKDAKYNGKHHVDLTDGTEEILSPAMGQEASREQQHGRQQE